MYDNSFARQGTALAGAALSASAKSTGHVGAGRHTGPRRLGRRSLPIGRAAAVLAAVVVLASGTPSASAQDYGPTTLVRKISGLSEKLELTTNTSRILTLEKNIPRVQVNNPELLAVTPLSATQVQISAKKAGVTQVNLWDEDDNIHTVDVLIYGDARELTVALQTQFPHSSIRVYRYSESLVLTGFVDRPDHVGPIMRLAEDYAPKVINNISVGGVQQILLKVKVMEISRTKLSRFAADFAYLSSNGGFAASSVSGLLRNVTNTVGGVQSLTDTGGQTFEFGVTDGNDALFGFLDILEENKVAKTLSEPNLTAVSGRPAQFNVGGEIPIVVPQSLGTASIEFKPFGTQIDFLPIVLGNGNIRLEVRPRISDIDDTRSVTIQDFVIPALTVRQVDTAVEMKAGQTFALGGLVQERANSLNRGLPYVKDLPIIGVPFRKTESEVEEIELLILVTPEFVDAMDANQVPCSGPGMFTTTPSRRDLYCSGHVEVPAHCNPYSGMTACGEPNSGYGCSTCPNTGGATCGNAGSYAVGPMTTTDGNSMPGGVGYDNSYDAYGPSMAEPTWVPADQGPMYDGPANHADELPAMQVPAGRDAPVTQPEAPPAAPESNGTGAYYGPSGANQVAARPPASGPQYSVAAAPQYTPPRPYSPSRQPVYVRNATNPNNQQQPAGSTSVRQRQTGLIGPVGYDPQ